MEKLDPKILAVGTRIFDDWFAENENQISEMGGCDSHSLLVALWAAWKNLGERRAA